MLVVHKCRSSRWFFIGADVAAAYVLRHIIIIYLNIAPIGTHSHEFQLVVLYICYKTIVCRCYSHASVARPHMLFIIVCWSSVNANVTGDLLEHQLATNQVESRCYYHKRVARPSYTCSSSSCIVVHKFRSSRWVSIDAGVAACLTTRYRHLNMQHHSAADSQLPANY